MWTDTAVRKPFCGALTVSLAPIYLDLRDELRRQRGPLYRRVAAAIRDAIHAGYYEPGSALPAERRLASTLSVSRITVVAAYDLLREEGLVERRRGSGTRVVERPPGADPWVGTGIRQLMGNPALAATDAQTPLEGINFSVAALPAPAAVAEAAAAAAAHDVASMLTGFGYEPYGYPPLRRAIADHYSVRGLPTSPNEILVTTGAQQAISLLASLLAGPGSVAVIEDPTYAGVLDACRAVGATPLGAPVDAGGVQVGPLADIVRRAAPKFIYLIPSYHNPTGVALDASRAEQIAHLAARFQVPLIDDQSLTGLGWSDSAEPPALANVSPELAVTVGSLSKVVWGGLRVGWIRAPARLIDKLVRLKSSIDLGNPLLSQAVAARLMPDIEAIAAKRRADLARHYDLLADALRAELPDWAWTRPSGGLSVWIRAPGLEPAFTAFAQRHGVGIAPGTAFSASGGHQDRLRLTLGNDDDAIAAGIRALAAAWHAWAAVGDATRPALHVVV